MASVSTCLPRPTGPLLFVIRSRSAMCSRQMTEKLARSRDGWKQHEKHETSNVQTSVSGVSKHQTSTIAPAPAIDGAVGPLGRPTGTLLVDKKAPLAWARACRSRERETRPKTRRTAAGTPTALPRARGEQPRRGTGAYHPCVPSMRACAICMCAYCMEKKSPAFTCLTWWPHAMAHMGGLWPAVAG